MSSLCLYLNCSGDSVTYLAETLEIEGYGCGLIDVQGRLVTEKKVNESLFLCCDFCEDSFVDESKLPILRQMKKNQNNVSIKDINHVVWVKISRYSIRKVRLYICDKFGNIPSFKSGSLQCSLLLIPSWQV